jgi:hypothetical protein
VELFDALAEAVLVGEDEGVGLGWDGLECWVGVGG